MNNTYTIIGGILALLLLAGAGYIVYGPSQGAITSTISLSSGATSTAATTSLADPAQDQTLQRLNRLEEVDINTEFLSADVFTSFEDFSIAIQPQPVGRDNPFLPSSVQGQAEITDDSLNVPATSTPPTTSQPQPQSTTSPTTTVDQLPSVDSTSSPATSTTQ